MPIFVTDRVGFIAHHMAVCGNQQSVLNVQIEIVTDSYLTEDAPLEHIDVMSFFLWLSNLVINPQEFCTCIHG